MNDDFIVRDNAAERLEQIVFATRGNYAEAGAHGNATGNKNRVVGWSAKIVPVLPFVGRNLPLIPAIADIRGIRCAQRHVVAGAVRLRIDFDNGRAVLAHLNEDVVNGKVIAIVFCCEVVQCKGNLPGINGFVEFDRVALPLPVLRDTAEIFHRHAINQKLQFGQRSFGQVRGKKVDDVKAELIGFGIANIERLFVKNAVPPIDNHHVTVGIVAVVFGFYPEILRKTTPAKGAVGNREKAVGWRKIPGVDQVGTQEQGIGADVIFARSKVATDIDIRTENAGAGLRSEHAGEDGRGE